MTIAVPRTASLEEFLKLLDIDESPAWEYINGEVVQKPMGGGKHSLLQKRLIVAIDAASSKYEALPELRCSFGNLSIVPDIVVVATNQLPVDENGEIASTGIEFPPLWVIEILSPNQSQTKVTGKILHCLKHGTQMGWLFDPSERCVLVYQRDRLPDLLAAADVLPVLEDLTLTLSVEEVFGWLKRKN
ncbi:MAG: Uma2 family endonuclease [Rhizonema sp. NSF051]|nr:Uma2 family endonuclease [Rhizonema sp. NSF051]